MIDRGNRALVVAATWFVILFGCYLSSIARPGFGTKWVQLQSLPERAATIEMSRVGYILATAESGNLYTLYPWQEDEPWTRYDPATAEFLGQPCEADDGSRFSIPRPPGNVVLRSSGDCVASAESRYYADVILLEDGEIWLWFYDYSAVSQSYLSLLLLTGGALGVLILIVGIVWKIQDG
jgi:hypothetical protein